MRGGRQLQSLNTQQVLKEFRQAIQLGGHQYAEQIEKANPDLKHEFELIRFEHWQGGTERKPLAAAV
jgi:hypothetical protein